MSRLRHRSLPAAVLGLLATAPVASTQDAAAAEPPAADPLPRVLLLGDRSFDNHFGNAAKALQGKAEVVRSPLGHLHTAAALRRIDELLGDGPWDLICCNYGLMDLMYRDPRTERIRAMSPAAGGVHAVSPEDFVENLSTLLDRFRATGAEVLWLSTMPIHPRSRSSALIADDIAGYNARATTVMEAREVPVLDTHAQIQDRLDEVENPRGVDRAHNELFKKSLAGPLIERITAQFGD